MTKRKKKNSQAQKKKDLMKILKERPSSAAGLAHKIGMSPKWVRGQIREMVSNHAHLDYVPNPERAREKLWYIPNSAVKENTLFLSGFSHEKQDFRFGCISDIHFGSKYHNSEGLSEILTRFVDEGIDTVLCSGDVLDGHNIYKGHNAEINSWSLEDQVLEAKTAFDVFPSLKILGISGNHDYSFVKSAGVRPLKVLEQDCDTFNFVGDLKCDLEIGGITYRLIHGGGGGYAKSYPIQRYLRNIVGVENPIHISQHGHYHTGMFLQDLGVNAFTPLSFQRPESEYCLRRGLVGPNGGVLLEFSTQSGRVSEFNPRYLYCSE